MRNLIKRGTIVLLLLSFALSFLVVSLPARNVSAEETGTLTGTVWFDDNSNGNRDPDEERARLATVRITGFGENGQRLEVTTDESGNYTVHLPPASYSIEVSAIKPGRPSPPGASITHKGELTALVDAGGTREASLPLIPQKGRVSAKIEIVWPHDAEGNAKPASQASLVNIGAYVFSGSYDSLVSVPCDWEGNVRLWSALNNNPAQLVGTGVKRTINRNDVKFPQWEFNNVDVSSALKASNKVYFFVTIDGADVSFDPVEGVSQSVSNVWAHATDARTLYPEPEIPTANTDVNEADAKIQIVWPHDDKGIFQPVSTAKRVNVSATVFQHGTSLAAPENWERDVYLLVSKNNDAVSKIVKGIRRIQNRNGKNYPVWDFNDIELSWTNEAGARYFFRTVVSGLPTYSAVWTHGADARTNFPKTDLPTGGCE